MYVCGFKLPGSVLPSLSPQISELQHWIVWVYPSWVLPRSRTWNNKGGGWVVRRHSSIQGCFKKVMGAGWKTGMRIIQWATGKGGGSDRGADGGRMRVTARHSTWSRETENKTSPGAQQPLKMGNPFCCGEKLLWIQREGFRHTCMSDKTLCALHVSVIFPCTYRLCWAWTPALQVLSPVRPLDGIWVLL